MATVIKMPQIGMTMTEGVVQEWLKQVGEPVKKGEAVAEISTDKLNAEVECEADGILRAIYVQKGEEVPVLTVLGIIAGENEPIEDRPAGKPAEETLKPYEKEPAIKPIKTENNDTRVKASPLARKTAEKLGISLNEVPFSEETGRIKQCDVITFYEKKTAGQKEEIQLAGEPARVSNIASGDTEKPMSPMRRIIGKRMTESIVTAPQVTLMCETNAGRLIALKHKLNTQNPDCKITFTDILIKLTATALRNVPQMNASKIKDSIVLHDNINIGVAVALDDGLVVPVIKDADGKGLKTISAMAKELIGRARDGKLTSDDTAGGTFTVSNLGGFGVEGFTPIVNLPECGILGVGKIVRKPVVDEDDQIVPADIMALSLTFDHRVVDGATAAKLLKLISDYVEDPDKSYL